jgi:hypothetical protein
MYDKLTPSATSPINVSTKDGGYTSFTTEEDWDTFYAACIQHIVDALEAGQEARDAIISA